MEVFSKMQIVSLQQVRESASHVAEPVFHVAEEMKSEVSSIWKNNDERDDILRTAMISGGILVAVSILVFVTGFLPVWARLLVIFATIGILGRWLMTKISDSTD